MGEGIVSAIGSAGSHLNVLESPDRISKTVLARRLDAQTAFEIVSIDIADVDVGENIGARLQADQAEADTRVARANAEGRRAMAVAEEGEMIAQIEQSRAKVLEAEAEVPKAIAEAFNSEKTDLDGVLQAPQHSGRYRHAFRHRQGRHDANREENDLTMTSLFAAGIDFGVIEVILVLAALIIGGLARLVGLHGPVQPPVRPPPPARPTPPDVAAEIDEFLRRAAQRRNPQAAPPRPPAPQPGGAGSQRPQPQPVRAEAVPAQPVRAEVVAEQPVGGEVADHVKKYLDSQSFDSRAGELGREVVQTVNREIDQHLRQVFDHSVSRFAAQPGEAAAVPVTEGTGAAATAAEVPAEQPFPTSAVDLAALFQPRPRPPGDRAQ